MKHIGKARYCRLIDLIPIIQDAEKNRINISLFINGYEIAVFGQQRYLSTLLSLKSLMTINNNQNISWAEHISAMPDNTAEQRPLSELQWTLAWLSGPTVDSDRRRNDVIQLRQWPNLTRLPHDGHCYRIAALLTRRHTSTVLASRILKIPEETIFRFYYAAHSSGLAFAVNRVSDASSVPEITPHKHQSLLGKLFNYLGGSQRQARI